jgi:hypothetical protein
MYIYIYLFIYIYISLHYRPPTLFVYFSFLCFCICFAARICFANRCFFAGVLRVRPTSLLALQCSIVRHISGNLFDPNSSTKPTQFFSLLAYGAQHQCKEGGKIWEPRKTWHIVTPGPPGLCRFSKKLPAGLCCPGLHMNMFWWCSHCVFDSSGNAQRIVHMVAALPMFL